MVEVSFPLFCMLSDFIIYKQNNIACGIMENSREVFGKINDFRIVGY